MAGTPMGLPSPESVRRAIESSEQKKKLFTDYLEAVAHLQTSIFEIVSAWRNLQLTQIQDLDAHIENLKNLQKQMSSPLVVPRVGVRS